MKLDDEAKHLKSGDVYFVESVTEVSFDAPEKYFQRVISFKSTFPNNEQAHPMYLIGSFYQPRYWRGGISPLASDALGYYKYKYEGVTFENGTSILKIHVVPKYKANNLFEGYIYLVDKTFNLYSIDLTLPVDYGKSYVKQQYVRVNSNVWLPATFSEYVDYKGFGAKASSLLVVSIKYDEVEPNKQQLIPLWLKRNIDTEKDNTTIVQPKIEKSRKQKKIDELLSKENITTREMIKLASLLKKQSEEDTAIKKDKLQEGINFKYKIEPNALKTDTSYWNESRPIPLTAEEVRSIGKKDSLNALFIVKDTLSKNGGYKFVKQPKIKPIHFIIGNTWHDSLYNEINYSGLINPLQIGFNPVDGFNYSMKSRLYYKFDTTYNLFFEPQIGYAFAREKLYWKIKSDFLYARQKMGSVNIDFGHWSTDFNDKNGIKRGLNTFSSLLFKTNYLKLYDNWYCKIGNSIEITNGLTFKTNVIYNKRKELFNNSNFSFFYTQSRNYSSNTPVNDYLNSNTGNFTALNVDATIEYTPFMHYRFGVNNLKRYNGSAFPTFSLNVKKGLTGVFSSKSNFVFLSGGISQQIKWGIDSKFNYTIVAGGFPVKPNLHFADFYHVSTQEMPVLFNTSTINCFSLLSYYKTSTPSQFVESHVNLSSAYMALKFLPLLNLTNLRENLSLGFLTTTKTREYVEIGYGLSNFPFKGSVNYVAGFDKSGFIAQGFKIVFFFGNSIVIGGE
jgi:hypothetical protein